MEDDDQLPPAPWDPAQARQIIRPILDSGVLSFSKHARQRMAERDIKEVDCVNVLRAGWPEPGEYENGSWRYRVQTQRMCCVVAVPDIHRVVVISVWRKDG